MSKFFIAAFLALTLMMAHAPVAKADANVDKVVAKMAEGDIAAICQGGRAAIAAAAQLATTALAQAGKISGDFAAIGAAAGLAFYEAKCS